jgi:1-pyrroline-5-carboxylate dehydrogenase
MSLGTFRVPPPHNEPVKAYGPGSPEKASIKKTLAAMSAHPIEIPLVIGGKRVETGSTEKSVMPHDHRHVLATFHQAGADHVAAAIDAAEKARPAWAAMPFEERAAVFLRPSCSRPRSATRSTRPRCWASRRPCTRPRSTRPAS